MKDEINLEVWEATKPIVEIFEEQRGKFHGVLSILRILAYKIISHELNTKEYDSMKDSPLMLSEHLSEIKKLTDQLYSYIYFIGFNDMTYRERYIRHNILKEAGKLKEIEKNLNRDKKGFFRRFFGIT